MSSIVYPIDTLITKDNFDSVLCEKLMQKLLYEGYLGMSQVFNRAAREAQDQGDKEKTKIFYLLAFVCAFDIAEHEITNPFKIKNYNANSWGQEVFDSLSTEGLNFFIEIIDLIQNPLLKARLADLIWSCHPKKQIKFAHIAIENYSKFPIDDNWHFLKIYWKRVIDMTKRLGKSTQTQLNEIILKIVNTIKSANNDDYLTYELAKLLLNIRDAHQYHPDIADKLSKYSIFLENDKDFSNASISYSLLSRYYNKNENITEYSNALYNSAICWVNLADISTSNMVKTLQYTKAVNMLLPISRAERIRLNADAEILRLKQLIKSCGEQSLDELTKTSLPPIDISPLTKRTENLISKKSLPIALRNFCNITKTNYASLLSDAKNNIHKFPLSWIASSTTISRDGRIVSIADATNIGEPLTDDTPKVQEQVFQAYYISVGLAVHCYILPALEILSQEHHIPNSFFGEIIEKSAIIPCGHENLFEMGIYAGYDGDFLTAAHILCPQLENLIRNILNNNGIITTTLDSSGVTSEKGLSSLIDEPYLKTFFGENTVFEIKAIFCDSRGANLRNEIAHGLVNDEMYQSDSIIYAWWLIFKIVFNSFYASVIQQNLDS